MARLLKKWWPAPLLPLSYFAASRLLTLQDSTILDQTHLHTVSEKQFKKGHLMNEFIRFIPGKDGTDPAGKLQLSIVRYKERLHNQLFHPNFTVDLVSVASMGERQYYQELQKRLDNYDIVIWEVFTCQPVFEKNIWEVLEDTNSKQNSQYINGIVSSTLQSTLDKARREAHDLSLVLTNDYLRRRPSWKPGSPNLSTILYRELQRRRQRRMETTPLHDRLTSLRDIGYKLRTHPWQIVAPFPMPYIVYLAFSCDDPVLGSVDVLEDILKFGMFSRSAALVFWEAWRLSASCRHNKDYEDSTTGLGEYSVIIGERNKVAIEELKGAIKRGEHSIAILYDPRPMPDFHRRLTEEFGLVPTSMDWLTAWSVKEGPKSKYIQQFLNKFPSEKRTLILTSLIFAILVGHISAWQFFGIKYLLELTIFNFLAYLIIS